MPDRLDVRRVDLSTIDIRTLTPAEWEALKREVARRAHAERAGAARAFGRLLQSLWTANRPGPDGFDPHCTSATVARQSCDGRGSMVEPCGVTGAAVSAYAAGDGVGKKGCEPCR